jgi:ribokinase
MADKPRICMLGSSNIDLISRVPRLPMPGETLIGSRFQMGFGGKGANQAVMAAKLGAQVSVVTKLGTDIFGDNTLKNYEKHGIDTTYVLFDDERFSGVAPIAVDENTGQNSIIIVPGANDALSPEDARTAAPAIQAAQILICQLEVPIETTLEAFRIARQKPGVMTILNPAPAAPLPDELLMLTDILAPNEVEVSMLTAMPTDTLEQATAAGRALQARGAKTVIITLGARGALILEGSAAPVHVSTTPVQAVDSTGAGDAFIGSLAYFIGVGRSLADAVERACAIATQSVLKPGTQVSFPWRDDVKDIVGE